MLKIILIVLGCLVGSSLGRWLAEKTAKKLLPSSTHDTDDAPSKTTTKTARKYPKNQFKRLDRNFELIFPTENTPSCGRRSIYNENLGYREDKATYSNILTDTIDNFDWRWEKRYNWFLKSFNSLCKQNQRMISLRDEIKDLLPQLEVDNLDQLINLVADVFDAYEKNQKDAIQLLARFYPSEVKHDQRDKMKPALLDLVKDNDRLITGLEQFCTSIRTYLANLYQDNAPAHLTDFTSLELLRKASEHINNAVSDAEASQAQAAKENEMEERLKRVPKITLLGDDVPLMESKSDPNVSNDDTDKIYVVSNHDLGL